jgi:hypothetical protein
VPGLPVWRWKDRHLPGPFIILVSARNRGGKSVARWHAVTGHDFSLPRVGEHLLRSLPPVRYELSRIAMIVDTIANV